MLISFKKEKLNKLLSQVFIFLACGIGPPFLGKSAIKRSPLLGHGAIITDHMILVVEERCATNLGRRMFVTKCQQIMKHLKKGKSTS